MVWERISPCERCGKEGPWGRHVAEAHGKYLCYDCLKKLEIRIQYWQDVEDAFREWLSHKDKIFSSLLSKYYRE